MPENAPQTHTCPDCGYQWQHGQHGGHSCVDRLRAALGMTQRRFRGSWADGFTVALTGYEMEAIRQALGIEPSPHDAVPADVAALSEVPDAAANAVNVADTGGTSVAGDDDDDGGANGADGA